METIADIVREMRRCECSPNGSPDNLRGCDVVADFADRIEAATAQNRENCAEKENAAKTPADSPVSAQRDFVVLREAVSKIAGYSKDLLSLLRHEKGERFALGVKCEAENALAALERIATNETC